MVVFPLEYQVTDFDYPTMPQDLLSNMAEEIGIPIIDLLPVYQRACQEKTPSSCQVEDRYLFADVWMHPSPFGHKLTAAEIQNSLIGLLDESISVSASP
jgi:phospholipase/lecithinase/hemolysin